MEIKTLAQVDDKIITNQDLYKEIKILKYFYNDTSNNQNEFLNKIAINNLIELNIKKIEVNKKEVQISDIEATNFLKIILKKNNKSIEDFKQHLTDISYYNHILEKIKIEQSWNKLIMQKFSNLVNINIDEILSKKDNTKNIDDQILIEKNKKLNSYSESYFNEVKKNNLVIYQ